MSKDNQFKKSVTVGEHRGRIRLLFSRCVSQENWNCRQKYFYLGLEANEVNYLLAEKIALEIQQDLRANKLDKTLQSYLPECMLRSKVGTFYDPTEISIPLIELYEQFCEHIKPRLGITTFKQRHEGYYLRGLQKCPQNISDPIAIRNQLLNVRSNYHTCNILNLLSEMIEWARDAGLIHPNAENSFKKLKKGIPSQPPPPKTPQLVLDSVPAYFRDKDIRAFSRQEAELIIDGFRVLASEKPDIAYMYDFVRFLFWTGCRPGEASALSWQKIASDFSYLIFDQSYECNTIRIINPLKTAKDGTFARKFPCQVKLQELLRELWEKRTYEDDLVFHNSIGTPATYKNIYCRWMGDRRRSKLGIVTQLLNEGKVRQYLKPYATRHTWITLQLQAGVPVKNVAKLAGNSPEVIFKYYESLHTDAPPILEV